MSENFSLVSILLCHPCASVSNISISLFIFAIHIQESNIFQYFSMHDIFSSTLGCIGEMSCRPILRVTTHTRWCGSVAVICSVVKSSIPITADLASCKECPTRSDGTHTVGMQGNAAAGSLWPLKRLYNHTPLFPPIIIKPRSIFKIHKFIHCHENATFLFSSVQRARVEKTQYGR
jgi:hypothetical protein